MFEEISQQVLKIILEEIKKEKNITAIKKQVIDPIILHIFLQIQPFFIATIVYFIFTTISVIILLYVLLQKS